MGESSSGYHRVRQATHKGSWCSDNAKELDSDWLEKAGPLHNGPACAIIAPHAGYTYCSDTAAFAFKQIVPDRVKRVFALGPSHVVFISGCGLTSSGKYRTPLGDLYVDTQGKINNDLLSSDAFEIMNIRNEETEHSIEMQMLFIAKVMERRPARSFTIVPILVGPLTTARQIQYGKIFAHYLEDPQNFFVISSDFCHWGNRVRYSPTNPSSGKPIHEQIVVLDQRYVVAISALNPPVFNDNLKKTQNTISGRNPICVMLQVWALGRCTPVAAYLVAKEQPPDDPDDKRITPAMSAAYKVYNVDPSKMLATLGADLST
ncbi:UPF0103/Mediator of ErbB2-driven cell motility (Memo-related) [Aphelenchoides avenae]|nr:UPF0103/Mediator of ErbB2-driven cell motility (Memo-related) [Aphelenchus avenae]